MRWIRVVSGDANGLADVEGTTPRGVSLGIAAGFASFADAALRHQSWHFAARLFRQNDPGDWDPVMAEAAAALAERVRAGAGCAHVN